MQAILATAGLTLYQLSQRSTRLYGRGSPYFIPHNLYYDLRTATFSPSIYQFLALSRISGYLLADWLRVFAIDLEDIPRLQVQLPSHRTSLLDTTLVDPNAWVPWFHNRTANTSVPAMAPMGQLLERSEPRRLHVVAGLATRSFLYAKIGDEDALAFPDLLPGSIVRVNPEISFQRTPERLCLVRSGVSPSDHGPLGASLASLPSPPRCAANHWITRFARST